MQLQEIPSIYARIWEQLQKKRKNNKSDTEIKKMAGEYRKYIELNGLRKEEVEQLVRRTGAEAYKRGHTYSHLCEPNIYRFGYELRKDEDYDMQTVQQQVLATIQELDEKAQAQNTEIIAQNTEILAKLEGLLNQHGLLEALNMAVGIAIEGVDKDYIMNKLKKKYTTTQPQKVTLTIYLNRLQKLYLDEEERKEQAEDITYKQLPYPQEQASEPQEQASEPTRQHDPIIHQSSKPLRYTLVIPESLDAQWRKLLEDYNQKVQECEEGLARGEYQEDYVKIKVQQQLMKILDQSNDLPQDQIAQRQCIDNVTNLILDLV